MANYSKEEIAAFGRKDKLNSRMSAVKATSVNFEGKEIDFKGFKVFADEVYAWLRQDQLSESLEPKVDTPAKDNKSLPTPTPDQKKVLDLIESKIGGSTMSFEHTCELVLQYSTEVAGASSPTYPKSMNSVQGIVEWISN